MSATTNGLAKFDPAGFDRHGDEADASTEFDGRAPPNDLRAEAAVISAMLIDPEAVARVASIVAPEHFYSEAHRRICEACFALFAKGQPVDNVQVATWLRDRGRLDQVGGAAYLTEVLTAAPAVAHVGAYADTVHAKWRARQLILACQRVVAQGYAGDIDVDELRVELEADVNRLAPLGDEALWGPELAREVGPIPWVSRGLALAPGRPSVLGGIGGTRKGWFGQDLMLAVALGAPMLGRFATQQGRTLYLDFEQTEHVTRERFQLLAKGRGVDLASLGRTVGYRWRPVRTMAPKTDGDRSRVVDALCRMAEGIALVVVDSVRACSPGVDENSVFASSPLDVATEAAEKTGACFLFFDHAGKPDPTNGRARKHAQRGHSSKLDASQALLVFTAAKGEPTLVTCERAQAVPETDWPADFRFTLQAANGGLQLIEVRAREEAQTDAAAARFAKVVDEVRKCVRDRPGIAGTEAVRELVGGTAQTVRAAVNTLLASGELVERPVPGRGKSRRLFRIQDAPPMERG